MYVAEPIKLALNYLNLNDAKNEIEDVVNDIKAKTFSHPLNKDEINFDNLNYIQKSIYYFLDYVGNALQDLSKYYFKFTYSVTKYALDTNTIYLSDLGKIVKKVISVRSDNIEIPYITTATQIILEKVEPKVIITFEYIPLYPTSLKDVVEIKSDLFVNAIVYKICSEYCLVNNLYDECTFWEKRYIQEIRDLKQEMSSKTFRSYPLY